jgi:hypothetical protein
MVTSDMPRTVLRSGPELAPQVCVQRCALLTLVLASCASAGTRRFPDREPLWHEPEKTFSPAPKEVKGSDAQLALPNYYWALDRQLAFRQLGRALDVNSVDEVPTSSFWQPRQIAGEDTRHGGEDGPGLDVAHDLKVLKAKTLGMTGGFVVEDSSGAKFMLKFEPPGQLGLWTGSEAATTRILWALGYNVPDNRVVLVDPARIMPTAKGPSVEQIALVLSRAARDPDGRLRAMASHFLPGEILGPMRWYGVRRDDPNDRVPHDRRRELRALRLIYAWLNNRDAKSNNTLDTYVDGKVRHHLLDFSATLGAVSGQRPGDDVLLGALSPRIEPYLFEFMSANASFLSLDDSDAAWTARLLLSLDASQLRGAAASTGWSPIDQERLVRRLLSRRADVVRAIFVRASSLATPEVAGNRVCARDLGRLVHFRLRYAAPAVSVGDRVCVPVPDEDGYHVVRMTVAEHGPTRKMTVHVIRGDDELRIVGVERE